jgi:hypothetical protein
MRLLAAQYENDIEDLQFRLQAIKAKIMAEIKVTEKNTLGICLSMPILRIFYWLQFCILLDLLPFLIYSLLKHAETRSASNRRLSVNAGLYCFRKLF